MSMPISAADWKHAFLEYCDGDPALDNHVDGARECRLHFDAGELGTSTVKLEHERRPLRWHVGRSNQKVTLRLINESVDDDATVVDLYSYELPDHSTTLPAQQFTTPVLTPPSGLFVARNQKTETGVIVPPGLVLKGLSGLGVSPQLRRRRPLPQDIEELVDVYRRWATARLVRHPLCFSYRNRILATIESDICDLFYQESKIVGGAATETRPERIRNSIYEPKVRFLLPTLRAEILDLRPSSRGDYLARKLFPLLSCSTTTIPSPDPVNGRRWIAEFVLRLASAPETLAQWATDHLGQGLLFVLKHNSLIRVARYVVLSGDVAAGAKPLSAGPLHHGWEWS
ncbi:MAG: hypothetical protein LC114_03470 [Bryobacterales bacterium]|nr:hypothetical protein [Bryobacterales bacterium]